VTACFLGLGSNLGHRRVLLGQALQALASREVQVVAASSIYETAPVGPVLHQPPFLNMAAHLETGLQPHELLLRCQAVERQLGRPDDRPVDKGPRIIDLDLLLMGGKVLRSEALELPHPELSNRAFVLAPLLELDPGLVDPRNGAPLAPRLEDLLQEQEVRKVASPCPLPSPDLDGR